MHLPEHGETGAPASLVSASELRGSTSLIESRSSAISRKQPLRILAVMPSADCERSKTLQLFVQVFARDKARARFFIIDKCSQAEDT